MMRINLIRDEKAERRRAQQSAAAKRWRERNPEKARAADANHRVRNLESEREKDRDRQRVARQAPDFREKANARRAKWLAKPGVRERQTERLKEWVAADPARARRSARNSHLKRAYGITYDQMLQMLAEQGGRCALCSTVLDPLGRSPKSRVCVDHCHETKRVRGLLCVRHNNALGALGDNEEGLLKAVSYLRGAK